MIRDPRLWLALAAGPLACLVLASSTPVSWSPGWPAALSAFLLSVAVYPPLEEWLFRGELQPLLARYLRVTIGPVSAANMATSAMFAALHLVFHPPAWAVSVFLPSLVFGYFRERSGGLAAPIALHATYNAAYLLLLAGG